MAGLLLRSAPDTMMSRILGEPPRNFRTTIITNAGPDTYEVIERVTEPGAVSEQTRPLGLAFPTGIFSLSHVALPFPMNDSLYGLQPADSDEFVQLGYGRNAKVFPSFFLREQVADQVVDVEALPDNDGRAPRLVVKPGGYGPVVPLV